VLNHKALTKDFLNPFAHDLIRGSGKSTMYVNCYDHNVGMTDIPMHSHPRASYSDAGYSEVKLVLMIQCLL